MTMIATIHAVAALCLVRNPLIVFGWSRFSVAALGGTGNRQQTRCDSGVGCRRILAGHAHDNIAQMVGIMTDDITGLQKMA